MQDAQAGRKVDTASTSWAVWRLRLSVKPRLCSASDRFCHAVSPKDRRRLRDVLDVGGLLDAVLLLSLKILLTMPTASRSARGFAHLLHVQPPCLDALDALA